MRLIAILLLALWTGAASAHHEAEGRMRVILVEEQGQDTVLYVRLPAPLLFAAESLARTSALDRVEAPFLRTELRQDIWVHWLDRQAIAADWPGFAARISEALVITLDGVPVTPELTEFAIHGVDALPVFGTPEEARISLAVPSDGMDPQVSTAFVDARLQIDGTGSLTIQSNLDERAVPPQIYIENIVVDHRTDPAQEIIRLGALDQAITLEGQ